MSNRPGTVSIGNRAEDVNAALAVFIGDDLSPEPVSSEKPLPVVVRGFQIPNHNDIQIDYVSGTNKPSYMTFRLNGTEVYWLMFTYDGSGNLTRIQPD